jgi:hypothetical protein
MGVYIGPPGRGRDGAPGQLGVGVALQVAGSYVI